MRKEMWFKELIILLAVGVFSTVHADAYLEELQPNQTVHGFSVVNLYENSSDRAMGVRFISDRYGFIIDLLQIESVPQAFYWVKTPPTSSKGEPHACEHLLLGKGNRGRYVAALEDMTLANSTAFTAQTRTCYHFNTTAGEGTFYQIFEAKLQALLHPDFTDEEIRREVCHIGIDIDPKDSTLSIDEKGTVYTEMVSAFEKPWYYFYSPMNKMVYGENHPLSYTSGGDPAVMRTMVPKDIWQFHEEMYHLANMGAIIAIPSGINIDSFLMEISGILDRCQAFPDSSDNVGIGSFQFPPPAMAPIGTTRLVNYPSEKTGDPGYVMYSWPADLKMDYTELFMLELFLDAFAGGQTSNLYDLFINSQTRKIDLGGNYVFGSVDSDLGNSIYFGLTGIDNTYVNKTMVDSIGRMIVDETRLVHDFIDGSNELNEFNKRVASILQRNKKQIDNYLNSPPMFGYRRGVGAGWLRLLESLEDEAGYRKSLIIRDRFAYADSLLASNDNIWKDFIDNWRLLSIQPYIVGVSPSAAMLTKESEAKENRLAGYIEGFRRKYEVTDEQEAIALYKEEFDAKTSELEALGGKDKLPGFIDNPPMTLDDQLNYKTLTLPDGIPMVASTFENMTSSKVGIAFRLDVIPESLLVYAPFLPTILTDIGVTKDGEIVPYDKMHERLRGEVLSLNAYFDHGFQTGRTEMILSGRGNNLKELKQALGWMDAALYSPYLSTENLPRMMDVIDQALISYRNRMKGSEESWVDYPARAYRFQRDPLILSTNCFLTEAHHYQRLKWMLTDPGSDQEQKELIAFLNVLEDYGTGKNRDELFAVLTTLEGNRESTDKATLSDPGPDLSGLSSSSQAVITEIAKTLKTILPDVPDANLENDWVYLCSEIRADIIMQPKKALEEINNVLDLIRRVDNARMFMISNSVDRKVTLDIIGNFVGKLDSEQPSVRQRYAPRDRLVERLRSREPYLDKPVYVGLVNEGTRNGVLIFSARQAGTYDTSDAAVLNFLTGKLYSGGGPHGLFMKTWAAGLAYSNGYRINQGNGRARYYAERCPDVAETMRFVAGELMKATDDPDLTDYAVAQVFLRSRAPSKYEQRGEAMASDLADGITPERVRAFRNKVLQVRNRDGLYDDLKTRMEAVYGQVLIGYGPSLAESNDGVFFLIGPESQFESLEQHIETVEGKQVAHRLYPRDYWLTMKRK